MHLNLIGWLTRVVVTFGLCVTALSSSERAQVSSNPPATAGGSDKQRDALVDVGGYRLHFRVVDGRSPTIVLESGGGADSSEWSSLQPQLARLTGLAVVSYDRAGFGES